MNYLEDLYTGSFVCLGFVGFFPIAHDLELLTLLPSSPKHWGYRNAWQETKCFLTIFRQLLLMNKDFFVIVFLRQDFSVTLESWNSLCKPG